MRRSLGLVAAVVLAASALVGCSADSAPGDLCPVVGEALIAQLVPAPEPLVNSRNPGDYQNAATCTATSAHGGGRTGHLEVTLTRFGACYPDSDGESCDTRRSRANGEYEGQCEFLRVNPETMGPAVAVPALGERSCATALVDDRMRLVTVHLFTQVNGDVVSVRYVAAPSSVELAAGAAATVANNVWARL